MNRGVGIVSIEEDERSRMGEKRLRGKESKQTAMGEGMCSHFMDLGATSIYILVHMKLVEPGVLEKMRVKLVFFNISRVVGSCPKRPLSY
jgi:hypothetical protein